MTTIKLKLTPALQKLYDEIQRVGYSYRPSHQRRGMTRAVWGRLIGQLYRMQMIQVVGGVAYPLTASCAPKETGKELTSWSKPRCGICNTTEVRDFHHYTNRCDACYKSGGEL